jgi:uncharacterized membrane protein
MQRSYFTIAEIMLLIAIAAIFLSAGRIAYQVRDEISKNIQQLYIQRAVSGMVIGIIVGVGIGSSRRRWIVGIIGGLLGGGLVGGFAATVISIPQNLPLAMIGSAVLLLGGIVVRILSRKSLENGDS